MVFNKGVYGFFKRDKPSQEVKNDYKLEIKEIKHTELETKISDINVAAQVLHEDIKDLVEELKMLIIQRLEEEPKKHADKEKPETHQSLPLKSVEGERCRNI